MRFQQIIQAVYFQPWNITREGWSAVHAIVKPRLQDPTSPLPKAEEDPEYDFFGNKIPKMQVVESGEGKIVIIPIFGTLIQHAGLFEKLCGARSYDDISRDLDAAVGVRDLQKIVLHIGSPGGMCVGNQETAGKISRLRESGIRIEAITDTQICSAAYNLAAGANRIVSTRSAVVGSIGSILAMLDESLAYEMAGYKQELIKSGALKGTGWSGTSLSDDQRAYLQGIVDRYAGMFKDHVQRYRPVDEETMQGQVFIGEAAAEAGLVDDIVEEIESLMSGDGGEDLEDWN